MTNVCPKMTDPDVESSAGQDAGNCRAVSHLNSGYS